MIRAIVIVIIIGIVFIAYSSCVVAGRKDRIDYLDEEMDCLVCNVGKERACKFCDVDWDKLEEQHYE